MIEMWDNIFASQNNEIRTALDNNDGQLAFRLMHEELNKTWDEIHRVVIPGGIVCINIGDATRSINKNFQLFSSHAVIINYFNSIGFQSLPQILWRKPTNAPNKFMGSGMLPPSAYVTLEHEHILIFRKNLKREFGKKTEKEIRRESAFFWEERNVWFSDIWEIKGASQNMGSESSRQRSGAFPFELAYRLINMFSIKGDFILDPFVGTGTTTLAAMVSCRNSMGVEIDPNFVQIINNRIDEVVDFGNKYIKKRFKAHSTYISNRIEKKGPTKYINEVINEPVMTRQELKLEISMLDKIVKRNNTEFEALYH
jgi:modification methylase